MNEPQPHRRGPERHGRDPELGDVAAAASAAAGGGRRPTLVMEEKSQYSNEVAKSQDSKKATVEAGAPP